tara:strand:+ start:124 stop:435 length:312 start_codon:yes stop_codon:yes gene_type:complete
LSDSEILLKAAINRITARIKEKVINSAQEFSDFAEEMPQRFQDEWSSFKDEVIEESERLAKQTDSDKEQKSNQPASQEDLTQAKIDNLRSKVIEINKSIEEGN